MTKVWLVISVLTLLITGCSTVMDIEPATANQPHASLQTTDHIRISRINGRSAESFTHRIAFYRVQPGPVVLEVHYQQLFEHKDGNHDVIKSPSGFITFLAEAGRSYQFDAPALSTTKEAFVFSQQPTLVLRDTATNTIVDYTAQWSDPKSLAQTLLGWSQPEPGSQAPQPSPLDANPLETLKHDWLRASEQERQTFLQWIETH